MKSYPIMVCNMFMGQKWIPQFLPRLKAVVPRVIHCDPRSRKLTVNLPCSTLVSSQATPWSSASATAPLLQSQMRRSPRTPGARGWGEKYKKTRRCLFEYLGENMGKPNNPQVNHDFHYFSTAGCDYIPFSDRSIWWNIKSQDCTSECSWMGHGDPKIILSIYSDRFVDTPKKGNGCHVWDGNMHKQLL